MGLTISGKIRGGVVELGHQGRHNLSTTSEVSANTTQLPLGDNATACVDFRC